MHGALLLSRVLLVLDPAAPAAWDEEARVALARDPAVEVVEIDPAGALRAQSALRESLAAAHACASGVRARYTGGDLGAMADESERCETEHAAALATREGRPVLVDLLLSRGLAELGQSDAAGARAAFARAVAIDPSANLDPNLFPPSASVAFAEAKNAAFSAPRAEAVVRTVPAGAIVTVDGARLGPSPASALLIPTEHLVRADLPGHRPAVLRTELLGLGEPIRLEPLPPEEARADASAWIASGAPLDAAILRAAASALGADVVVVVARDAAQGRPAATLYRLPSGSASRLAGRDDGVADVVSHVLHPPAPPRPRPAPVQAPGLLDAWWFWTAAGVVVVGTVGLALYPTLFPPDRHVQSYRLVVDPP